MKSVVGTFHVPIAKICNVTLINLILIENQHVILI